MKLEKNKKYLHLVFAFLFLSKISAASNDPIDILDGFDPLQGSPRSATPTEEEPQTATEIDHTEIDHKEEFLHKLSVISRRFCHKDAASFEREQREFFDSLKYGEQHHLTAKDVEETIKALPKQSASQLNFGLQAQIWLNEYKRTTKA